MSLLASEVQTSITRFSHSTKSLIPFCDVSLANMLVLKYQLRFLERRCTVCSVTQSCPILPPHGLHHAGFPVLQYLLEVVAKRFSPEYEISALEVLNQSPTKALLIITQLRYKSFVVGRIGWPTNIYF